MAGKKPAQIARTTNLKTSIRQRITQDRLKYKVDPHDWKCFVIFLAISSLNDAPAHYRSMFCGKPSAISVEAYELAEIFSWLLLKAEDAAEASNLCYRLADIWSYAIKLWEVCNG